MAWASVALVGGAEFGPQEVLFHPGLEEVADHREGPEKEQAQVQRAQRSPQPEREVARVGGMPHVPQGAARDELVVSEHHRLRDEESPQGGRGPEEEQRRREAERHSDDAQGGPRRGDLAEAEKNEEGRHQPVPREEECGEDSARTWGLDLARRCPERGGDHPDE